MGLSRHFTAAQAVENHQACIGRDGLVMELLHRRMIGDLFGDLDVGMVSRDRRAIREKIGTEPGFRSCDRHEKRAAQPFRSEVDGFLPLNRH